MPFIPWPKHRFVRHLERHGHDLRQRLHLVDLDPLDPLVLVDTYPNIEYFDLRGMLKGKVRVVLQADRAAWSAIAFRAEGGPWLITANPWHAPTRQRVSLMEETAHIILDHKPTQMIPDAATGLPRRTFTPSKEKEAYGVAGAALVPYRGLVPLLRNGHSVDEIATNYQVSRDLVRMRINVTRLHKTCR